jgi:hypothetical protein
MRVKAWASALSLFVLVGLVGCGGDDDGSGALTTSEKKYCSLVKQFKTPTFPENPNPEQFTEIMGDYVAKNAKYFEDLVKAAPAEIKADVEKAVATLRQVATGDVTAYEGLNLAKADQWEEDHCNS